MAQPDGELVRDLIARFFNGHDPDLAPPAGQRRTDDAK
jgi:hypothetical protein